ncbi:MAG: hypothetical protein AAFY71_10665 [Bacteroidota bacterium]
MNSRKIFASKEIVPSIIEDLHHVDEDNKHAVYEIEGETWHYFESDSMYVEGKIPVLFKTPKPSAKELMTMALESPYNDEAYGACLLLKRVGTK